MAMHFSILAWRMPKTQESVRLQLIEWQRVGHNWSALACKEKTDISVNEFSTSLCMGRCKILYLLKSFLDIHLNCLGPVPYFSILNPIRVHSCGCHVGWWLDGAVISVVYWYGRQHSYPQKGRKAVHRMMKMSKCLIKCLLGHTETMEHREEF